MRRHCEGRSGGPRVGLRVLEIEEEEGAGREAGGGCLRRRARESIVGGGGGAFARALCFWGGEHFSVGGGKLSVL